MSGIKVHYVTTNCGRWVELLVNGKRIATIDNDVAAVLGIVPGQTGVISWTPISETATMQEVAEELKGENHG